MKLSDIANDLANPELTPTQRKDAFEHLRRWLAERPRDDEAKRLWNEHKTEFGRDDAEAPLSRDTSGEGFAALNEAERRYTRPAAAERERTVAGGEDELRTLGRGTEERTPLVLFAGVNAVVLALAAVIALAALLAWWLA